MAASTAAGLLMAKVLPPADALLPESPTGVILPEHASTPLSRISFANAPFDV